MTDSKAASIDDLARQLAQNQSDNLDLYLQAYLKATGLGIEDITLAQQTFIENGIAGTRYRCERKVPADPRTARLNPAFAAPYGAAQHTLQQKAAALDDWMQRTEWVQEEKATFPFNTLGMHRADVMRRAIDEMRKLVAVPRTDQEIVDETDDLARELDVAINGDGAAEQASLCDVVSQLTKELPALRADAHRYRIWRDQILAGDKKFLADVQDKLPAEVGVDRPPTAQEWDSVIDYAAQCAAQRKEKP